MSGRIERKLMAHMVDSTFYGTTPNWVRLGKDLEEYNIAMNPDVEETTNIWNETSIVNKGYKPSAEADPYYAVVGEPLFEGLQEIIDNRSTGDSTLTRVLDVHMWTLASGKCKAFMEDAHLIPNSHGGGNGGYNIPFTVRYCGNRVEGVYDTETKKFTEGSVSAG